MGTPQPAPARNSAEVMAQYVVPTSAFNILRNLEQILRILMSWSSVTLDVFIRRDFGERYLDVGRVLLGLLTLRFFLGLANLQTALSWVPGIQPLASQRTINRWFMTCFVLLTLVHLLRIALRNHAGVPWHSHSFGVSWLDFLTMLPPVRIGDIQLRISDWMLYRFIEPGLCLFIAATLVPGPSFTRSWLIWCSIAMLIHNNLIFNAQRGRFLDLLDSQIESGHYNSVREEALGDASKYQTAGHMVMPMPPKPLLESMEAAEIEATVHETMGGVAEATVDGIENQTN